MKKLTPKIPNSKKNSKQTTSRFKNEGIAAIMELIANFSPSFLAINLNGLSTLKVLKILSFCSYSIFALEPCVSSIRIKTSESKDTNPSKIFQKLLIYEFFPLKMNPNVINLSTISRQKIAVVMISRTYKTWCLVVSGSSRGLSRARIMLAKIIVIIMVISNFGSITILPKNLLIMFVFEKRKNDFPSRLSN